MAYLVLARKYRPERFSEIIGQEHVTRTLSNAIKDHRVHHAYLFCGVRGLGKTTAARILAKCLVCEQGPTDDPCNVCEQCVSVNEIRSVDVIEIDGASNNKVEHVRGLREQVNYLPQSARRKVYIIDEVHMLTDSAFNALLKTLEEPPPHVTFIFATTDPHKVLATILSRVSRLDFRRVTVPVLVDHLRNLLQREGLEAEDEGLHLVAQASEGSVRDALTLLDKIIAFAADTDRILAEEVRTILGHAGRFAIAELLDAVFARDATTVVARFDEITRAGSDLLQLAIGILQHLRDLTVVKLCNTRDVLLDVSDGLYDRLVAQAKDVDSVVLTQHFDRFSRVLEGLETSQIPRLSVEMGLLELVNAEPLIPVGDLVDRLDALASAATSSTPSPAGAAGSTSANPRTSSRGQETPSGASASAAPEADPPPSSAPPTPAPSEPPRSEPHPPSTSSLPALPESTLAKQLWGMVGSTIDLSGESASPAPDGDSEFALTPPDEDPADTPTHDPVDAACPSSRCTPREPIDWRGMDPIAAWEALLDCIRKEDELLFAVLGELGLSKLGEGVLELAGARNSFARDQMGERPELRAALHHLIEEYFGEALELRLLDTAPSFPELPSLVLLEERRRAARQAEVEGRAHQNPRIRALLAAFDGELRRVKPLDQQSNQA